ncbi:hypothetical protein MBLNU13_g04423t1 [Cladosporium sp. NU13]
MDQMHEVIGQHHDVANPSPLRQGADEGLLGHSNVLPPSDWGFAAQAFDNASLETAQVNDGFAAWLLSPLGSHGWGLDVAQLPPMNYGAAQLVRINAPTARSDYRNLADLIITGLRWEIHTSEDAQPPVNLWVAQSLLLLEFYEKLFSSRQLHERAHIHHVSTLTLLRRGSPLGGRPGTDTPLEGPNTPDHAQDEARVEIQPLPDLDTWWRRWANNESMLRVVFMAYEMDTLHAAMFGHESSLLPSDVGLTLPCDDVLWMAESADGLRQLETTFSLYGIRPKKFLDGLKEYLHGDSSPSHFRARLTLAIGLLSVGCHIRPREKHNKLFETMPSQAERKKWTTMMLQALDQWKHGLDDALSSTVPACEVGPTRQSLDPEPAVRYHLAYITMHIDILNCQILAGTELLLGRRVSQKELASATSCYLIHLSSRGPMSRRDIRNQQRRMGIPAALILVSTGLGVCIWPPSLYGRTNTPWGHARQTTP